MGTETIQQSTTSLDTTRRSILLQIITDRYKGERVSQDFIDQQIDYFLQKLNQGLPALTPRPQSGMTDARKVDDELSEYEIDILSAYAQLEHVEAQIKQHQRLNESVLNDVRLKIRKADEKLEVYRHQMMDQSAHKVFFETFLDYNNVERNEKFYTERDGTLVTADKRLKIDVNRNALKLPVIQTENALVNFSGVKLANIEIKKQLGQGYITNQNPEHSVDKAIDTSYETFWNESILADEPLAVNLGLEYYGLDFGATCELEITFDFITRINEITLTPFTEYPLEVVAIHTYSSDDADEEFDLVSPQSYLKNQESTDVMSFQFQDIVCKKIVVILNQKHYVKRDMLIELGNKNLTDAWLRSQKQIELSADTIFKPVYIDQFMKTPNFFQLNKFLSKHEIEKEIDKFEESYVPVKRQVCKYEYQYGLYNLAINRNDYHFSGVYVTSPLATGNIHTATLEVKEEHRVLPEISIPVTSIEYYLTDSDSPTVEDWLPILPKNVKTIYSEYLPFRFDFEDMKEYIAYTRFFAKEVLAVRRNGHKLIPHQDYELSGKLVTMYDYDPSAVYTIDYNPQPSAYQIDFLKRYTDGQGNTLGRTIVEQFDQLNKGSLTLKWTPFVDKERLNEQSIEWNPTYLANKYLPIKVRLVLPTGQQVEQPIDSDEQGTMITNRTDYFNPNMSLLEPFTGENYQYRVVENEIHFNTELPEGTHVIVEYSYLTGPIRMKTIMRRNLHSAEGLTPFLHEYKAVFQSLQ